MVVVEDDKPHVGKGNDFKISSALGIALAAPVAVAVVAAEKSKEHDLGRGGRTGRVERDWGSGCVWECVYWT